MRAAYMLELGTPEVIRYGERPEPEPGPTDVLVDLIATTVNPVDTLIRSGAYATPLPWPFIVGRDAVGTVAAAGPGAPGFEAGELVWTNSLGHAGRQGAAAERIVMPVDRLYRLPPGVDPATAVTVAHPAATAYLALFTHGRIRPGETVVVAGAAGNVGSALVGLAHEAGARAVAVAAARDHAYCRILGADETVDYAAPDLADRLRRVCPGGVDVYVDTSGHHELGETLDLLAPRGRVVVLAGGAARPVLPIGALYTSDRSIIGFVISRASTVELAEAAGAVNRRLAAGTLSPRSTETIGLSRLAAAHRRVEAGRLGGSRFVVVP